MAAQLKLRDESESARVVRSIGQRLTQGSRYQYDFHLAEDSTVNAFALPGGIVVVNTGLVGATRRPEELAGVLAHEIEHVELRHSLRQIAKQLGLSATVALLMGQVGASLGGRVAEQLLSLQFTRAAEQQADERAVEVLTRSRIDPTGLPDFFGRLADEPSPPTILSSHPASADRQSSLRALIRAQGRLPGVALDYGLWPPR
jgi:predicted Zn-dependent protease